MSLLAARRIMRLTPLVACFLALGLAQPVFAGGGPERALLLIDPGDPDSMRLGHEYAQLRALSPERILYMRPGAVDYASLVDFQGRALEGELEARGIADQVDYILIAPGRDFFVPLPVGTITTGCQKVSRLSISSAYGFLPFADAILAGGLSDQLSNHYYGARFSDPDRELAFDASLPWFNGRPLDLPDAKRYRIAFLLGYLGERGNSAEEIERMMQRSVAADFSRPEGSFYFMNTSDEIRTQDRRRLWPYTVESIRRLGGKAEVLDGKLPIGRQDALGILTGLTNPQVVGADVGILPGAFADHLTSFAGMFDNGSQGKMSQWIAAGASGSAGTVEEPCTGGKFPDPDLHARYLAGMSLGEALWRSTPWTAFQTLFYGDPLTRPFARPPEVSLPGLPEGPLSGRLYLTAEASAADPESEIGAIDVLVDGRRLAITYPGALFELDTRELADGWHDLRLLAFVDEALRTQGRWQAEILVANRGRSVQLEATAAGPGEPWTFALSARGGPVVELRLRQSSRLVAAKRGSAARFELGAGMLGSGPTRLQAEALYADGGFARSRPIEVELQAAPDASEDPMQDPGDLPPFEPTLILAPGSTRLLDLPRPGAGAGDLQLEIVLAPAQATLRRGANTWLIEVPAEARGRDLLRYEPRQAGAAAGPAGQVTLLYCAPGATDAESLRLCPGGGRLWLPRLSKPAAE